MSDDYHGGIDRATRGELWAMRKRALRERRRAFQAKWGGVAIHTTEEEAERDREQYFCFYPKDVAYNRHVARAHW